MQSKTTKILAIFLLASMFIAGKSKKRYSYSDEESCDSDEENWGWNNNWAQDSNTNAAGKAVSNGNGYSSVSAGKQGVSTEAYGKQGAASESAFNQDTSAWGVSNGFNNGKHGNNAFSDNWAENSATQAGTKAVGFGEAGVKSNAGRDGANVFAQGTGGTQSQVGWNNSENAWKESFAFGAKNRLLGDRKKSKKHYNYSDDESCEDDYHPKNKHHHQSDDESCDDDYGHNNKHNNKGSSFGWNNNWATDSNTKAYGEANSKGEGYSSVSAGKGGVNTEAYGKKGANSKSAFEQSNSDWGVSNGFNNNGKGDNNAFSNNWGSNDATKSFTSAEGFGEAGVKSQSNKDGANVFAKGTEGTKSNLGWQNSDNNWNESFAFGNNKRRLTQKNENSCSDEDNGRDNHGGKNRRGSANNLIDDLRKEIYQLKKENEELRRNCNRNRGGKGVGASQ